MSMPRHKLQRCALDHSYFVSLRDHISLNLELLQQPESLSDPGICHPYPFHIVLELQLCTETLLLFVTYVVRI